MFIHTKAEPIALVRMVDRFLFSVVVVGLAPCIECSVTKKTFWSIGSDNIVLVLLFA